MDAKISAETNDRVCKWSQAVFFRSGGYRLFIGVYSCPFAVAFAGFLPPFDKPGPVVLVGGSARANLMTVGPWVSSSTLGAARVRGNPVRKN